MSRHVRSALALALAAATFAGACGSSAGALRTPGPSAPVIAAPSPVPMPSPAVHPSYPPLTLADLVALADQGVARRFIGMEGQPIGGGCNRGWMRVYEPAGVPPQQEAADLVRVSIERHAFQQSCGAFIFGTTDATYCNCYHAEHGYVEIDRGPAAEPAPGKMLVLFSQTDDGSSPYDWRIEVDAPTG